MRYAVAVLLALALLPAAVPAAQVSVTLIATTDMHGNLYPVDYYTDRPAARGLAKAATIINEIRRQAPNSLLIDCGDTIQGTALESVWQYYTQTGHLPAPLRFNGPAPTAEPMMAAMNQLGYAAMVVGNHEFNFGLKNIERARGDARFPWLSANITADSGASVKPFTPYIVRTVGGIRIAVIGLTTPVIPGWEEAAHYRGYRFADAVATAREMVAELHAKEKPDVIIAAIHAGLGTREHSVAPAENMVLQVATEVPGIDAIVFGHSHQQLDNERVNGVLLQQPKNWASSVARIDFTLDNSAGRWQVVNKQGRNIAVTAETPADPRILEVARPYHELTERFLNEPVATSPVEMDGRGARFIDTPLLDAIQAVQLEYAKADVSFTALFQDGVHVAAGPVTVRQLAAMYIYDNTLYAIEGNGRMVKEALENAARYFQSCHDSACKQGPLINTAVMPFNYDIAEGVEYEIDLTRPEGQRIVNLRRNGHPLAPDEKLRIAVNNYRAGGSGGYTMFRGAKVLWQSSETIRDLLIEYYQKHRTFPARANNNWRITPEAAVETLKQGARQ